MPNYKPLSQEGQKMSIYLKETIPHPQGSVVYYIHRNALHKGIVKSFEVKKYATFEEPTWEIRTAKGSTHFVKDANLIYASRAYALDQLEKFVWNPEPTIF